jgi:hypothetical protein
MSEEQQNKAATISREDLYRQVWETLMSRLGAHYGISGKRAQKNLRPAERPLPAAR